MRSDGIAVFPPLLNDDAGFLEDVEHLAVEKFIAHLRWRLTQEAEFAADYQPAYGRAEARTAEIVLLLGVPTSDPGVPDPIYAVLDAANTAEGAHVTACETVNEADDTSMWDCNAAWRGLPVSLRDHIGFIAFDRVFQGSLSGQAYASEDYVLPCGEARGEASTASARG